MKGEKAQQHREIGSGIEGWSREFIFLLVLGKTPEFVCLVKVQHDGETEGKGKSQWNRWARAHAEG